MVLVLVGNSNHDAQKKTFLLEKNATCGCSRSDHACIPFSKLPSDKITMIEHLQKIK